MPVALAHPMASPLARLSPGATPLRPRRTPLKRAYSASMPGTRVKLHDWAPFSMFDALLSYGSIEVEKKASAELVFLPGVRELNETSSIVHSDIPPAGWPLPCPSGDRRLGQTGSERRDRR